MKPARAIQHTRPGRLEARWGRTERHAKESIVYVWEEWDGPAVGKATSFCLAEALENIVVNDGKCMRDILIERGYDITTLRFSIDRKANGASETDCKETTLSAGINPSVT